MLKHTAISIDPAINIESLSGPARSRFCLRGLHMEEGSKWKKAPFGRGLRVEESSVWKKDPARPGGPVRPRAGPVGGPWVHEPISCHTHRDWNGTMDQCGQERYRLQYYRGCAVIDFNHLLFEEPRDFLGVREYNQSNVDRLVKIFEIEGCGNVQTHEKVHRRWGRLWWNSWDSLRLVHITDLSRSSQEGTILETAFPKMNHT